MTQVGPVLLCFDGSAAAADAIAAAGRLLESREAEVLVVLEPRRGWDRSDPATILEVPVSRLLRRALSLDRIDREVAERVLERGLELAHEAGFASRGRVETGTPWRAICTAAERVDASTIVLGSRGLSRAGAIAFGGVSSAVSARSGRPVLIISGATVGVVEHRRLGRAGTTGHGEAR